MKKKPADVERMNGSSVGIHVGPNPQLCLPRAVSQIDPTGLFESLDIYRRPAELSQVFEDGNKGRFMLEVRSHEKK